MSSATTQKNRLDNTSASYIQILALLLLPRILSASYNLIHDTDETYNYWEPLHFLVHGTGFQTWEYSPVYAIRSWTYIALHALPLWPLKSITTKVQQFYLSRGILGLISASTEAFLVSTVCVVLGNEIAVITLIGLFGSTGMFNASTAFLPSSFTMYTSTLGLAFSLKKQYFRATVVFALGAIVGWPFSVVLFAPLALFSLFEPRFSIYNYLRGAMVGLQVLLVSTVLDFKYYKVWTIVPLNIVLYNVFSSRDGRGPDLFGTEPASYYLRNLLLNFNILTLFAILSLPLTAINSRARIARSKALSGYFTWMLIFTLQAHKEERFMYPAYPALVLSSAIGLVSFLEVVRPITTTLASVINFRPKVFEDTCKYFVLFLSCSASIFRTHSMITSYSAPLELFSNLPSGKTYCLGSDWYRFPTSFLLPTNTSLKFIESDFKGLLPGQFQESWDIPSGMNDRNQWEANKVVPAQACDCLINWKPTRSTSHQYYFLDRETGTKKHGYYGYDCTFTETNADRLNRKGEDLFGRKLDKEGKRFEDGALDGAIQRPADW